jgi:hypothetical protein
LSEFLCLGKKHGFSGDFGHVEMLVSKEAQLEVWPLVEQWLRKSPQVAAELAQAELARNNEVSPE